VAFWGWFCVLPVLLTAFVFYFFRDPDRKAPEGPRLLVAPADGRVTEIAEVEEESLDGKAQRVSIFLSVFDVHVNRAPCSGRVESVEYHRGRFVNAMKAESARVNERSEVMLESDEVPGLRVLVRQVAGLIARRIVCDAAPGRNLARGERFGMIKFGSRTDVCVPAGRLTDIRVKVGDHVSGGKTVIGAIQ
jgi:phosphatidylserine decarboxylase